MARLEQDYHGTIDDLNTGVAKKVIAPGRYKAIITQCDYVQNKQKNGWNLVPTFQIVEGEYRGEEITQWLCVKHPSQQTQEIAISKKARLGVILCGTPNPADTDLLLSKPLIIQTDTEANNYTNSQGAEVKGTNNIIKQYHPINGEFKDLVGGKKSGAPVQVDLDDDVPF